MKRNKKGQLGGLQNLLVGIVPVVIMLVIAFTIMEKGEERIFADASTQSHTNATIAITVDGFTVVNRTCANGQNIGISSVSNDSVADGVNNALLNAGNYTIDDSTINVSDDGLGGGVAGLGSNVKITYSCAERTSGINATAELKSGTQTIPEFVGIIIITVIGIFLVGMIGLVRRRG